MISNMKHRDRAYSLPLLVAAAALFLSGAFLDQLTITSNDYTAVLMAAAGCACASALLCAANWRGSGGRMRILLSAGVVVNTAVLADCLRRIIAL